jgi:hypothetical protein
MSGVRVLKAPRLRRNNIVNFVREATGIDNSVVFAIPPHAGFYIIECGDDNITEKDKFYPMVDDEVANILLENRLGKYFTLGTRAIF